MELLAKVIHNGLISFSLREGVRSLLESVEAGLCSEVEVRLGAMPVDQPEAPASGGFNNWKPVVTVNPELRGKIDEHGFAHELFHILRFGVLGMPFVRVNTQMVTNRAVGLELRSLCDDISNQMEHVAFFPRLEALGFDPHTDADRWKLNQLAKGLPGTVKVGDITYSNLILKSGFHMLLGHDHGLRQNVLELFERASAGVSAKGEQVASEVRGNDLWRADRLRIAYRKAFGIARIPKELIVFHRFDGKVKREHSDTFR